MHVALRIPYPDHSGGEIQYNGKAKARLNPTREYSNHLQTHSVQFGRTLTDKQ